MIVPVPSTCPWTRWPPRRSARRTERSRLTGVPGRERAEAGAGQGLAHHVGGERVAGVAGNGETDAVDRDGVTVGHAAGHLGAAYGQPRRVAQVIDGDDLAELFHDSGEHPALPSSEHAWLRGARAVTRALSAAGFTPDARVLPPIRTLTVGSGVSPDQPRPLGALGRGLSPPVRSFTDPGARFVLVNSLPHELFRRDCGIPHTAGRTGTASSLDRRVISRILLVASSAATL